MDKEQANNVGTNYLAQVKWCITLVPFQSNLAPLPLKVENHRVDEVGVSDYLPVSYTF